MHDADLQDVIPLRGPVRGMAFAGTEDVRPRDIGFLSTPWRVILVVALPYWIAANALLNLSSLLAALGNESTVAHGLSYTQGVRLVLDLLMAVVVMMAYRVALYIGWPEENRWRTVLSHLSVAVLVAVLSRPLLLCSVTVVLGQDVDWKRMLAPNNDRVLQLWVSLGLGFLLPYLLGLALVVGVQILAKLRRSEHERAALQSAWTQAQLQTLRMQLNPHFLFNTFNTIATLLDATQERTSRARDLMLALSSLCRRTLVAGESEWSTIADELELANDYLRIQAARFENRLIYEIKLDPKVADCQVPSLILQPLVENAAIHGVSDSRDLLRIRIEAAKAKSAAERPALELVVVNETSGSIDSTPGSGVGIRNTKARLTVCYGMDAHFHVESIGSGAYLARMILPLRPGP